MRGLILFLFFVSFGFCAQTIEISASKFVANDKSGITRIIGNVVVKKSQDILYADEVIVKTDKKRTPTSYTANGNVKFKVTLQNNRRLKGKANKVIYNALLDEYRLYGNVLVEEIGNTNVIDGQEVVLSNKSGYANVVGNDKKPAKIIFSLDKKNKDVLK